MTQPVRDSKRLLSDQKAVFWDLPAGLEAIGEQLWAALTVLKNLSEKEVCKNRKRTIGHDDSSMLLDQAGF